MSEEECDLEIEEEKKRIDRKRKNLEHDLKELQKQKMVIFDKNKYFVNISIQLSENISDHFMIEIYNAVIDNLIPFFQHSNYTTTYTIFLLFISFF